VLFAGRGRAAVPAKGQPGLLKIEVLKMEVMIGLKDFTE